MYSYNRIHIVGYQTQPVAVRQTPTGTSVTDLNIVAPYTYTSDSGEEITGKSFHTVTIWGAMADIAGQYVRAGSQIFISGRLQTDSWEDEQSGEKRSKTKIVALDMIMLDPNDVQVELPADANAATKAVNRAEIVGNITRDPEVRTTTSGQNVVSLGVATNDRWKDKASGEDRERSEFHNVVVWGDLGDSIAKHAKKGGRVYVSGRVQTRSWETQTGQKRYTTEIVADQVSLLGVANPAITDTIQADAAAAPVADMGAAPSAAPVSEGAPAPSAEQEPVTVPDVKYESEVKAEDLPF